MQHKKRLFKTIAISLPFLFFFLLEVLLRAFGYGKDYRLFIASEEQPGYVVMNPVVSEKYFSRKENATVGYFEPFSSKKGRNSCRIFVMGASTAVGYPYFRNGSFHRMVEYLLQQTYPELDIEVINTSLTGVNSYTLNDFAKKIIQYEPDAILVYAGHNEYYGALGAAATGLAGRWPPVIKFTIAMRQLRLWQLFAGLYQKMAGSKKPVSLQESLMKRMAGEQLVPFESPVFRAGLKQYKSNLTHMLRVFGAAGIPVFMSNVVSNEKDQRPLVSALRAQTDSTVFFRTFRKTQKAFEAHDWDDVEKHTRMLLQLDSTYAGTYYLMGQMALKTATEEKARNYFMKARKYDHLRFRAPDEISDMIHGLCQNPGAYLVDIENAFRSKSPQGIVGRELMLEHLHPNLEGYALMAETFYKAILEKEVIKSPLRPILLPETWQQYPLTEVDTLFGDYEIQILKERWPFNEAIEVDTTNRTLPEALAGALAVNQLSWEQAMEKLYQHYHQKNDFKNTLRVAEAVIMEHPNQAPFYAKAGSIALRLKLFHKGGDYFQKAYNLKPSPVYARFSALSLVHQNKLEQSLEFLAKAARDGQSDTKAASLMNALESIAQMENRLEQENTNVQLLNQLAGIYYTVGLSSKARALIDKALLLEPANIGSVRLLRQMDQPHR